MVSKIICFFDPRKALSQLSFIWYLFFFGKTELTQKDVNEVKLKVVINVEKESSGFTVTEYRKMKEKSQNYNQIPA